MKIKRVILFVCIICLCYGVIDCIKIYGDEEIKYRLKVNVAGNYIAIYDINSSSMPIKVFTCSSFTDRVQEPIVYTIKGKENWIKLADGTYTKNVSRLDGTLAITSVPYSEQKDDKLIFEKFNELGSSYTGENIWLSAADSKWIYDNCATGTEVEIYSDENAIEISIKPNPIRIPVDSENKNWDPSDKVPANPWSICTVKIENAHNLYTSKNSEFNPLQGIKGYDTCGNDITDKIILMGNYDISKVGEYKVTYYLEDSIGSKASADISIFVNEKQEETVKASAGEIKKEEKSMKEKVKVLLFLVVLSCGVAAILVKYSKK